MSFTLPWNEMDCLRLLLQHSRCRDGMGEEKREKFRTRKNKIGATTNFSRGKMLGQEIYLMF